MSNETTYIPLTELDRQSFQGTSQMLKAAVTYMDPSSGKMLAMLARMLELKQATAPASKKFSKISVNIALRRKPNRLTSF